MIVEQPRLLIIYLDCLCLSLLAVVGQFAQSHVPPLQPPQPFPHLWAASALTHLSLSAALTVLNAPKSVSMMKQSSVFQLWKSQKDWHLGHQSKWFYCKRLTDGYTPYFWRRGFGFAILLRSRRRSSRRGMRPARMKATV